MLDGVERPTFGKKMRNLERPTPAQLLVFSEIRCYRSFRKPKKNLARPSRHPFRRTLGVFLYQN